MLEYKNYLINSAKHAPVMFSAKYWLNKVDRASRIILTEEQIEKFNQQTYQIMEQKGWSDFYCDLSKYPSSISAKELLAISAKSSLADNFLKNNYYDKAGSLITESKKKEILKKADFTGLAEKITIQYGVAVKRVNLRVYPTDMILAKSATETHLDLCQLTALSAGSILVVLHSSPDNNWLYVQSEIYKGWLKSSAVALFDAGNKASYLSADNEFLIVTDSWLETEPDPSSLYHDKVTYQMGDKVNLLTEDLLTGDKLTADNEMKLTAEACYPVRVPAKNQAGMLEMKMALLAGSRGLNRGYLPYNRSNIIKQAFKMLGERYGWGGSYQRRDCSRFIMDIYRTVGLFLPRDASMQETGMAGQSIILAGSEIKRKKQLDKLLPGDLLFLKGHVMLLLGKVADEYYVIHNGSGYSLKNNGQTQSRAVYGVFIMSLDCYLKSGESTYLQALTSARKLY